MSFTLTITASGRDSKPSDRQMPLR